MLGYSGFRVHLEVEPAVKLIPSLRSQQSLPSTLLVFQILWPWDDMTISHEVAFRLGFHKAEGHVESKPKQQSKILCFHPIAMDSCFYNTNVPHIYRT